jgi:uncharacterized integral membrane protein (TIGR00698 family)
LLGNVRKLAPGLLAVYLVAVVSGLFSRMRAPTVSLEALTIGIILGTALGSLVRLPAVLKPGFTFSSDMLLRAGIILLGFKLDFRSLVGLGPKVLILVLVLVPATLLLACALGRVLKADVRLSALVGVGSCICGTSAIAAVAPVVGASKEDSVVAISVVSFLGAIGVFVYSTVGLTDSLTDAQYGVWSGATLPAVAHCLAAAFARGGAAGEIGTLVKMARVVLLVPVALALGLAFGRGGDEAGVSPVPRSAARRATAQFPTYVLWFVLAGLVRSTGLVPVAVLGATAKLSATLILMAMIAMGLGVDFRSIRDRGLKGLVLGSLVLLALSATVYLVVSRFF